MPELPASPIPPKEFFESWLPSTFREMELPEDTRSVEVQLGVHLEGEGGGEWVFHLKGGDLRVTEGPREAADFSVVQSVADWRGALWEGRGGVFGQQAAAIFRPPAGRPAASGMLGAGPPSPAALGALRQLNGLIRMVVTGAGAVPEWRVAFKLGPGPVPDEPTTTVTVGLEDAEAMGRGELDPMQAFMAGRVQVAGDIALLMQMQAVQMQAASGS